MTGEVREVSSQLPVSGLQDCWHLRRRRSQVSRGNVRRLFPAVVRKAILTGMSEAIVAASIAAASAMGGGLVTAFATRSLETARLRAASREKIEERKLEAAQAYSTAAFAWHEWLTFTAREGSDVRDQQAIVEENNRRSKERQAAYRVLLLVSSERLHRWLTGPLAQAEYELNRHVTSAVSEGRALSPEAIEARRAFGKLLREDMVDQLRIEVTALREPPRFR